MRLGRAAPSAPRSSSPPSDDRNDTVFIATSRPVGTCSARCTIPPEPFPSTRRIRKSSSRSPFRASSAVSGPAAGAVPCASSSSTCPVAGAAAAVVVPAFTLSVDAAESFSAALAPPAALVPSLTIPLREISKPPSRYTPSAPTSPRGSRVTLSSTSGAGLFVRCIGIVPLSFPRGRPPRSVARKRVPSVTPEKEREKEEKKKVQTSKKARCVVLWQKNTQRRTRKGGRKVGGQG